MEESNEEETKGRDRSCYSRCFEGRDCIRPAGVRGSFGCGHFGKRGGAARIRPDFSRVEVLVGCQGPSPGRQPSCCIRATTPRATLNFHAETRADRLTKSNEVQTWLEDDTDRSKLVRACR